jgi:membrane protease YdiL (CAAX protease family)
MKFKLDFSPEKMRQIEEGEFSAVDLLVLIWTTVKKLKDKASVILWSSFILLLLWGFHGDMAVLGSLFGEGWTQKVTFGLAMVASLTLLGITSVFVFFASFQPGMQQEYPLFAQRVDGDVIWTISHWWEFLIYELIYLLFFITIEFAFRGYLLFGLSSIRTLQKTEDNRQVSIRRFGIYAILIQMLAYTTWHYGKPVPEMVGTVVWGICVAAIALRVRSIWPIIIPHWLYNVFLDLLIWKQLNKKILNLFS